MYLVWTLSRETNNMEYFVLFKTKEEALMKAEEISRSWSLPFKTVGEHFCNLDESDYTHLGRIQKVEFNEEIEFSNRFYK